MDYFPKVTDFGPTKASSLLQSSYADQIQQKYNKFFVAKFSFWWLIQTFLNTCIKNI